jgi:hypothetical protein
MISRACQHDTGYVQADQKQGEIGKRLITLSPLDLRHLDYDRVGVALFAIRTFRLGRGASTNAPGSPLQGNLQKAGL